MTNQRPSFIRRFAFGPGPDLPGYTRVTSDQLFDRELGYGFVTESVVAGDELLQIPELGSGFGINQAMLGQSITNILMQDRGADADDEADALRRSFCYSDRPDVPLWFRVRVPHTGNYNVTLLMGDKKAETTVTVFAERRRCVLRNATAKAGEFIEHAFTANVCDIIPRGKKERYTDDCLDIAIVGNKSCLNSLVVEEAAGVRTIYVAGDSTVTDQSAQYPYTPASSYCGWAQMLPLFLRPGVSVSNHAHSGLSTASFWPHWSIVEEAIGPGDFFFIQFGHNDQKNKSLDAFGGYAENLRKYIGKVRDKGAIPVVVTPVSRTTWNGPGNSFNDMLDDYARACIEVAREKGAYLIDLHAKSVAFILELGQRDSTRFFYPNDWTHHNDFGGCMMASFVVDGIKEAGIQPLIDYIKEVPSDWVSEAFAADRSAAEKALSSIHTAMREQVVLKSDIVDCRDISTHPAKVDIEEVVRRGIMRCEDGRFDPDGVVSRVDLLAMAIKAVKYLIINVYNDMYDDVLGDEWYAGMVQAAYDHGFIDQAMTPGKTLRPGQPVTQEEAVSIVVNAYRSKKGESEKPVTEPSGDPWPGKQVARWARGYIQAAQALGILSDDEIDRFEPGRAATRAQIAVMLKRLIELIYS